MEECYKYFRCKKKNCIMYGLSEDIKCWETDGTLCNDPGQEIIVKHELDKCLYCSYYKKALNLKE